MNQDARSVDVMTLKRDLDARRAEWDELLERHEAEARECRSKVRVAEREYKLSLDGVDVALVRRAEEILYIRGECTGGDDGSVVEDAVKWFAGDCVGGLREEVYGTKNYDRFYRQRSDHPYMMGPRHGNVVFSIELRDRKVELRDTDREACIYYLEKVVRLM